MDSKKKNAILSLDWNNRCTTLEGIWDCFPDVVAERFDKLLDSSESHKQRCESRHRASHSRIDEDLPATKLLMWEQELFETVFHDVLAGINAELWKRGKWTRGTQTALLRNVLPPIRLHVAWWFSRTMRPPLLLPSEQISAFESLKPLSDVDELRGWYRLGCIEKELTFSNRPLSRYSGYTVAFLGVSFNKNADLHPKDVSLFGQGNAELAWFAGSTQHVVLQNGTPGPLVCMDIHNDLLGRKDILMLPPTWQQVCGLNSGPWPGPLEMIDSEGHAAVVYRHWHVRPVGEHFGQEVPRLVGCDIVVRPDILTQICQAKGVEPVSVTQVFKSSTGDSQQIKRT
ncbi:MAG: hypothetical protein ACYS9C_00220 [Planctomycetota bacterium]|jgi:hypothetical protein